MDRDQIGLNIEHTECGVFCHHHMLLASGVTLSAEGYTPVFVLRSSLLSYKSTEHDRPAVIADISTIHVALYNARQWYYVASL